MPDLRKFCHSFLFLRIFPSEISWPLYPLPCQHWFESSKYGSYSKPMVEIQSNNQQKIHYFDTKMRWNIQMEDLWYFMLKDLLIGTYIGRACEKRGFLNLIFWTKIIECGKTLPKIHEINLSVNFLTDFDFIYFFPKNIKTSMLYF